MRVERLMDTNQQRTDRLHKHAKWLLQLGDGKLLTICGDVIEVPQHMVCEGPEKPEDHVYSNFENNMTNREYISERAIMSSTNDTIHERNFKFMEKFPGNMEISYSRDSCVEDDDVTLYDTEFWIESTCPEFHHIGCH